MVEWNHQPGEGLEDPKFLQLKHREVDKCNFDSHREHRHNLCNGFSIYRSKNLI